VVDGVVGGACSKPRLWGEAVRCLGIGPHRTRCQAGGVHGALRPQQVSWAQSLTRPAHRGGVMPLGELATEAVPEPFTPLPGRGSGCVRHPTRRTPGSGVCGLQRLWRSCSLLSLRSCDRHLGSVGRPGSAQQLRLPQRTPLDHKYWTPPPRRQQPRPDRLRGTTQRSRYRPLGLPSLPPIPQLIPLRLRHSYHRTPPSRTTLVESDATTT